MIVWRIRGFITTFLCCVVYSSCTQWYAHISAVLTVDCWFIIIQSKFIFQVITENYNVINAIALETTTILPPFSGTTWVSWYQKRTSGLYDARED